MSNDQFFQIIKEYTEQIQRQKGDLSEILIDRVKMDQQEENEKPKIVVKEIDLSSIEEFNNIVSIHGEDAGNAIQIGVKAHFEYLFNKMNFETETKNQKNKE